MKNRKVIISLLLSMLIILCATACGGSFAHKELVSQRQKVIFVDIKLTPIDMEYDFTVLKDKSFYVKKIDEYRQINESEITKLNDKDFQKVTSTVDALDNFYSDEGAYGDEYKVSLNGKNYRDCYYGNEVRSGYDDLLTCLIKLSPIEVCDVYGGSIKPDYAYNFFYNSNDKDKNKNITLKYDENTQTLSFSGKGRMEDYEYYPLWYDTAMPVNIVVNEGITRICADAFSAGIDGNSGESRTQFDQTKSVKLPESLTEIGDEAFYNSNSLESITIPKNVTKIGRMLFGDCDKLESVTFPGGIKKIPEYTCMYCKSLKSVTFEEGVEKIGGSAFNGCYKLSKLKLPSTLKRIGYCAFDGAALTEVKLPEKLEVIENKAFYGGKLKSVTIPKSVRKIGKYAFGYYWGVKKDGTDNAESDDLKLKDFTIKGYKGTAAQKYAEDNGFSFISLD